jgi:AbrB family looped-hinge helix DNA binding protein
MSENNEEIVKVSPRGQIVIPIDIRSELDIRTGDRLLVKKDGGQITIQKLIIKPK